MASSSKPENLPFLELLVRQFVTEMGKVIESEFCFLNILVKFKRVGEETKPQDGSRLVAARQVS